MSKLKNVKPAASADSEADALQQKLHDDAVKLRPPVRMPTYNPYTGEPLAAQNDMPVDYVFDDEAVEDLNAKALLAQRLGPSARFDVTKKDVAAVRHLTANRALTRLDEWLLKKFPMQDPSKRQLLKEWFPETDARAIKGIEKDMEIAKNVMRIKKVGPSSREDVLQMYNYEQGMYDSFLPFINAAEGRMQEEAIVAGTWREYYNSINAVLKNMLPFIGGTSVFGDRQQPAYRPVPFVTSSGDLMFGGPGNTALVTL